MPGWGYKIAEQDDLSRGLHSLGCNLRSHQEGEYKLKKYVARNSCIFV